MSVVRKLLGGGSARKKKTDGDPNKNKSKIEGFFSRKSQKTADNFFKEKVRKKGTDSSETGPKTPLEERMWAGKV